MRDVPLLKNTDGRHYVGSPDDLSARLALRFRDSQRAHDFERYLKTGPGHAFARRNFW